MIRSAACAALAFVVFAGFGLADEGGKKKKKKGSLGVSGEIAQVDAEKGTLTLKVRLKKKQTLDKEYKVTDRTAVTAVEGDNKVEVKGTSVADLLKKEQFKTGALVTVEPDSDGNTAKAITLGQGPPAKKKKKDQ
ncbi:MAG: hypothetical protein U0797_14815 [Gemmataceae bacterium]